MLEVNLSSVDINNRAILNNISFKVEKGSILGIIGINGAGKTTLFNTIFSNKNITLLNDKKLSQDKIAYIESENIFYPFLTGEEFLNLIGAKNNEFRKKIIQVFNIPMQTYISNMSTGQKKKISIISNLLIEREVYLFDESFNGLDFESYEILKKMLLSSIFKDKYVLISSHILESLTTLCDNIIQLKDGTIYKSYKNDDFPKIRTEYEKKLDLDLLELETSYNGQFAKMAGK